MTGIYGIYSYNLRASFPLGKKKDQKSFSAANIGKKYSDSVISQTVERINDEAAELKKDNSDKIRELLKNIDKNQSRDQNPYVTQKRDSESASKKSKKYKKYRYNFKEVASKILRAKNPASAALALQSAHKKVMDVKRKISSSEGDPEELQLALTHAKRMEMVARKKKHHLELEELVVNTQKRDRSSDIQDALVSAEEEKIIEKEDEIFKEREEILNEIYEEDTDGKHLSEEMMSELNEMISEYGEDELEELEKTLELFENMEIVDPHMSEEDFEELKRKHRSQEQRDIVKADMDYLKGLMKHLSFSYSNTSPASSALTFAGPISSGSSIDLQI